MVTTQTFLGGINYTVSVPSDGTEVLIAENYEGDNPKATSHRKRVDIYNEGSDNVRISFSSATASDGVKVASGDSISYNLSGEILLQAISIDTDSGATLKVVELIG